MRAMRLLAVPIVTWSLGCQALTTSGVEYVDCFPASDGNYVEKFNAENDQPGAERCWKTDNVLDRGFIRSDGEDLIIHPDADRGAAWTETRQGPLFYQRVEGNFFIMTRAEAVSTTPGKDHCLEQNEAAGLVVRRQDPPAHATLLVRPYFKEEEQRKNTDYCGDDPKFPALARISVESHGFAPYDARFVDGKGDDAEAYIALCRVDHQLFFFNQATVEIQDDARNDLEELVPSLEIGSGPVEVGLTATAELGTDTLPEGHFNWLVLEDLSDRPGDGCETVREFFKQPEWPP